MSKYLSDSVLSFPQKVSGYTFSMTGALIVTGLSLLLMRLLITAEFEPASDIDVCWISPPVLKIPKPPKKSPAPTKSIERLQPLKAPPRGKQGYSLNVDPSAAKSHLVMPSISVGSGFSVGELRIENSRPPIEHLLTAARYPHRAILRRIEGYVDVVFDISAAGFTENIRIVGAEPQGIFDKSAKAAVTRWRFKPQLSDGVATRFSGMKRRVRFELSDN